MPPVRVLTFQGRNRRCGPRVRPTVNAADARIAEFRRARFLRGDFTGGLIVPGENLQTAIARGDVADAGGFIHRRV
ncbi:MAG: hypothetical protein OXC17_12375 [Aestuariivita sp.]|nr:hypothetical protein [Aestuariivita sp.]